MSAPNDTEMSTQENETKTDEPETTTCREMPTITPDPGGNSDTTQEINNSQNNAIESTSTKENSIETETTPATLPQNDVEEETVSFKVIFNKQKFDVTLPIDNTIAKLKEHVHTLTKVPPSMQKVMLRGLAKDESTLREMKVTKVSKIMVVGSTPTDILSVGKPTAKEMEEEAKKDAASKEPLSKMKAHKTVLEKHKIPDDVIPGIKNVKEPLPSVPISGMYNKSGGKVRLTFKLELDQIWLGTKERTDKIPMNSVKSVVSEPIDGHEEYHILGLQLGPTEASRYWIYWVPAQYVDGIKDTILGKWQYF